MNDISFTLVYYVYVLLKGRSMNILIKTLTVVLLTILTSVTTIYAQANAKKTIVTVIKPYKGFTEPTVELTGSAFFSISSGVAAESAGKVKKIFVREGDNVKKDAELVQLDDEIISYSLEIAKATANMAKSNLDQAFKDYGRNKNLYDKKAVALSVFEDYETKYVNAQNEYQSSLASLSKLETEKNKMLVKSPITGSITSKDVEVGEWVTVGGLVATVASNSYEARISLPEKVLPYVKVGNKIILISNNKEYNGKVLSINKKANLATRTFESRISLGNDASLREGIIITARIPSGKPVAALFVKRDAVLTVNFSKGVYVESGGVARFVPVTVIGYKGKDVGIKGDITVDDNIILNGNNRIRNGSNITISSK